MNANMDIVDAHGGREEGVGAEAEEVVAVALFELGAGGPLMDKSSPQKVDKVPGVAEASRSTFCLIRGRRHLRLHGCCCRLLNRRPGCVCLLKIKQSYLRHPAAITLSYEIIINL